MSVTQNDDGTFELDGDGISTTWELFSGDTEEINGITYTYPANPNYT